MLLITDQIVYNFCYTFMTIVSVLMPVSIHCIDYPFLHISISQLNFNVLYFC